MQHWGGRSGPGLLPLTSYSLSTRPCTPVQAGWLLQPPTPPSLWLFQTHSSGTAKARLLWCYECHFPLFLGRGATLVSGKLWKLLDSLLKSAEGAPRHLNQRQEQKWECDGTRSSAVWGWWGARACLGGSGRGALGGIWEGEGGI